MLGLDDSEMLVKKADYIYISIELYKAHHNQDAEFPGWNF